MDMYVHTCIHTYIQTYIHTCTCAYTHHLAWTLQRTLTVMCHLHYLRASFIWVEVNLGCPTSALRVICAAIFSFGLVNSFSESVNNTCWLLMTSPNATFSLQQIVIKICGLSTMKCFCRQNRYMQPRSPVYIHTSWISNSLVHWWSQLYCRQCLLTPCVPRLLARDVLARCRSLLRKRIHYMPA